jgi:putative chitinase
MIVTPDTLAWIAGRPANDNMVSVIKGLIARPQSLKNRLRLAAYFGQGGEESGLWRYDREIWGKKPTAAQASYDTRTDLGNTAAADGDGYLYRGRSGLEITGKDAYARFTAWCHANVSETLPPDFVANPDLVNTDPWEGLAPIFVWEWKALDSVADRADVCELTHRINGGYTHLDQRIAYTDRAMQALADARDLVAWQHMKGLAPDGRIGPITRGALIMQLRTMPDVTFSL